MLSTEPDVPPLAGHLVLIAEDEPLNAFDIRQTLEDG
jgi:hypothetical protein